eukprot:3699010-Prymnesium_polylepis.1
MNASYAASTLSCDPERVASSMSGTSSGKTLAQRSSPLKVPAISSRLRGEAPASFSRRAYLGGGAGGRGCAGGVRV